MNWSALGACAALALPLAAGLPASAQDVTPEQRIENLCRLNPSLAVCTARLEGQAKTQGVDLAARVKTGESWGMSASTRSEIADCWAIWTAVQENVRAKGAQTWPADYTVDALGKRVAFWDKAVKAAYKDPEVKATMEPAKASALAARRADVASARIVEVAEMSGLCKADPRPDA